MFKNSVADGESLKIDEKKSGLVAVPQHGNRKLHGCLGSWNNARSDIYALSSIMGQLGLVLLSPQLVQG